MHSELIGVWSVDARFGPGAQADEMLAFRPDGTGWLEIWNFALCSVDFFEWTPTSPGWVIVTGTRSLKLDVKTNRLIDSPDRLEVMHLPYQVQEEETPSRQRMKVLRLQLLGINDGAYGTFDEDAGARLQRIFPRYGISLEE